MSFMVINTGRTASRAFYLNLSRQPGVLAFNRYAVDHVVRSYIERKRTRPLEQLGDGYDRFRMIHGPDAMLAIVFHAVRLRLNVP
ncbi:MAG: hypothetical protein ACYTGC_03635, partial [Planctomycetota bacterium]